MRPSFNGDVLEIPGIAVDNFQEFDKRAYFLSHCHEDHTNCLNKISSSVSSLQVSIYMSEPSAAIVETNIDSNLKSFIRPLKLGSTTITIPGDEENDELHVRVTLIPAGHCFGSVMFLFETPLKKILYTGDFRIGENDVSKIAALHKDKKPIKLDVLYVDTTFQGVDYRMFPKRSETMDYVTRGIKEWLKASNNNRVALVPSARYGYEYIFNEIYDQLKLKVYAGNNWDLYSKFLDQLPGVTNVETETKIHVCSKYARYCPLQCRTDTKHKYMYINFSAMKWRNFKPEDSVVEPAANNINVCFATHCSRSELMYFVEYLAPKKVVGFPEPYLGMETPKVHSGKRSTPFKSEKTTDLIPKKVSKDVLQRLFR